MRRLLSFNLLIFFFCLGLQSYTYAQDNIRSGVTLAKPKITPPTNFEPRPQKSGVTLEPEINSGVTLVTQNQKPWASIGVHYAFFTQTNNYSPLYQLTQKRSMGHGVDVFVELFYAPFASLYVGYQFMNYSFKGQPETLVANESKALIGGRIYVAGLFFGGGVYLNWATLRMEVPIINKFISTNDAYWGGYVDVGYRCDVVKDYFAIETGGRVYFPTEKIGGLGYSSDIANNIPGNADGRVIHWDWYIGGKLYL